MIAKHRFKNALHYKEFHTIPRTQRLPTFFDKGVVRFRSIPEATFPLSGYPVMGLAGSPHGLEVCLPPAACCLLPDTYLPTRLPPAACRLPPAACRLYPDSVSHPTPITCFLSPQVGTIGSNHGKALQYLRGDMQVPWLPVWIRRKVLPSGTLFLTRHSACFVHCQSPSPSLCLTPRSQRPVRLVGNPGCVCILRGSIGQILR